MGRGERPIKLRDSWFSPNAFRCSVAWSLVEVELLDGRWALWVTDVSQTPNAIRCSAAVRLRGISFVVERETAQIIS